MFKLVLNSFIALIIIIISFNLPVKAEDYSDKLVYNSDYQFSELKYCLDQNNKEVNALKVLLTKELELIEKNKKEINRLNEIVFFYSPENIVDVTKAFKNSELENIGELNLYDTDCGFPIYNGVQRKIDKLVAQSIKAKDKVEILKLKLYGLYKENQAIKSQIAYIKFRIS